MLTILQALAIWIHKLFLLYQVQKQVYATLESNASGWNMRIGIPFTLAEKNPAKNKNATKTKKTSCSEKKRLNINIAADAIKVLLKYKKEHTVSGILINNVR